VQFDSDIGEIISLDHQLVVVDRISYFQPFGGLLKRMHYEVGHSMKVKTMNGIRAPPQRLVQLNLVAFTRHFGGRIQFDLIALQKIMITIETWIVLPNVLLHKHCDVVLGIEKINVQDGRSRIEEGRNEGDPATGRDEERILPHCRHLLVEGQQIGLPSDNLDIEYTTEKFNRFVEVQIRRRFSLWMKST